MDELRTREILESQKIFFAKGHSEIKDFRIAMLDMLEVAILKNKEKLLDAVLGDLGKSRFEAVSTELAPLLAELRFVRNHVRAYMKTQRVKSEFFQLGARSLVRKRPYGAVLILSTWNFPILLSLLPLIDAIAAGNTVILKPSEKTPETAKVIHAMIDEYFVPEFVSVTEGDLALSTSLLGLDFDFVFFTGGVKSGREIAKVCVERGLPYALELGGKNPALVLDDADLVRSARNIMWAKTLNAGQVCVTMDEAWVHQSQLESFVAACKQALLDFWGSDALQNPNYTKIVNLSQLERLVDLTRDLSPIVGGKADPAALKFEPTIIVDPPADHAINHEEIFGPILVVRSYEELVKVEDEIEKRRWPLAIYVYTKSNEEGLLYSERFRYGSGGINESILQFSNPRLPMGGLGQSGVGRLKGRAGFNTFSYEQSMVIGAKFFDAKRYPPHDQKTMGFFEKLANLKLRGKGFRK